MLYEENESKNYSSSSIAPLITNSILRYISEGLEQEQLCIYLSMNTITKNHSEILISQLSNLYGFQTIDDHLMILKTDDYYINASCENLKPFDDLKKQILKESITGNKK
jgi:hypothetical protein